MSAKGTVGSEALTRQDPNWRLENGEVASVTGSEGNGELTREKMGASSSSTALRMARSRGFYSKYYRDLWEG